MDAASRQRLVSWVAKIGALDAELLTEPVRRSLVKWLSGIRDDEAVVALEMLDAAFAADEADMASMLWLIDQRLRPHIHTLGSTCTLFLELIVCQALYEVALMSVIESLERADPSKRRQILATLPVPNYGLRTANEILATAWRASPPEAQYRERIHRGEPRPFLGPRALIEVAIFLATRVEALVPREEAASFAAALEFARQTLAAPAPARLVSIPLRIQHRHVATIAQTVKEAAEQYLLGFGTGDVYRVARGAEATVRLLETADDATNELRRFLRDLDDELRRLDIVSALGKKAFKSPVVSAIHRAPNLWVARLANGNYALLQKHGRRTSWIEGGRDEVLGSIPDEHFEKAVLSAKEEK